MRTAEERLKAEQFKSKLLLGLLEAGTQLGPEAIERLKVMLSCIDKISEREPELIEALFKRLEAKGVEATIQ